MGIIRQVMQRVHRGHRKAVRKLHDLKYIFFEVTPQCNLECLHCGSDCKKGSGTGILPQEVILKTLKDIKSKYNSHGISVVLTGGEPMCYPGIFELGRKIYELEFPWGMVTNGLGWNEKVFKSAIKAGMHSITVSLDGFENDHNWLRGNNRSFLKAVSLIRALTAQPFYRAFDIVTCINKRNLSYIDDFYKFLIALGVPGWRITTIAPIGRAKKQEDLFLNSDQLRYLLEWIENKRINNSNELIPAYSGCDFFGSSYEKKIRNDFYFCKAGINISGIMANGDILACPNIDRRFSQGNIFKGDSVLDIWKDKYTIFRNREWMRRGECLSCEEWYNCEGNNFHLRDYTTTEPILCYHKELIKN